MAVRTNMGHKAVSQLEKTTTLAGTDLVLVTHEGASMKMEYGDFMTMADIHIVDTTAQQSTYRQVLSFYQGKDDSDMSNNVHIGDVCIPKDKVLAHGEVGTVTVDDQPYEGARVGDKYIDLTIENQTEHLYIPANSLVDIYTGEQNAQEVQIVVSNYVISATIVNGAVTEQKIAANAVTEAKLATALATKINNKIDQGQMYSLSDYGGVEGRAMVKDANDDNHIIITPEGIINKRTVNQGGIVIQDTETITATQLRALLNVSGNIQIQINAKADLSNGELVLSELPKTVKQVANDTERYALTTADVKEGFIVVVGSGQSAKMYIVNDTTHLDTSAGYLPIAADIVVTWNDIQNKPTNLSRYSAPVGSGSVGAITTPLTNQDIINDLTTGGTTKVLSAEQGKVLNQNITAANADITSINQNLAELKVVQNYGDTLTRNVSASTIATFDITVPQAVVGMVVGFAIENTETIVPMQVYMSSRTNVHLRVKNVSTGAQSFKFSCKYI